MADRTDHPVIPTDDLPTPRLELRWRDMTHEERVSSGGCHTSICDYDLVIGLREFDIRIEDADGRTGAGSREFRVNLSKTLSSGSAASRSHPYYIEGPFRDSSHAMWDGVQLGRLPIYKIAAGRAQLLDYPQHVTAAGVPVGDPSVGQQDAG